MRIAQKRIINPVNFLTDLQEGQSFYVTITDPASFQNRLQRIDFTNISIGNQLLPTIIGPITRFNANGGILRRRDLPMETVYIRCQRLARKLSHRLCSVQKIRS